MTALLFVDQEPVELGELPLEQVILQIQDYLGEQGRLIQRVAVNGAEISGDWQTALAEADIHDLSLTTVSAQQLLIITLRETADQLPHLCDGLNLVARAFRTGEDHHGFVAFGETIADLQSYLLFLNTVMPHLPQQGNAIETQIATLGEWLQEVMNVWEKEDYVLVGDYLRYELVPQIEAGEAWVRAVANELDH